MERSRGNLRGVVECLGSVDFSHGPAFPGADRAAFLLAQAWLGLGDAGRFGRLADEVASWPEPSAWTRWVLAQRRLQRLASASPESAAAPANAARIAGDRAADALAAELLLREGRTEEALRMADALAGDPAGRALALHVRALAHARSGADDSADLAALAAGDTSSALGRELTAGALVTLASRALERGGDAGALLARVPAGTRSSSRAAHLLAIVEIERGDTVSARVRLRTLLDSDPAYAGRREAALALAGLDLDRGDWAAAHAGYGAVDRDWLSVRDTLRGMLESGTFDALWAAWDADPGDPDALALDALPTAALADSFAVASLDLGAWPSPVVPAPGVAPRAGAPAADVLPPDAVRREQVLAAAARLAAGRGDVERSRWDAARERESLADLRRFLAGGLRSTRVEREGLVPCRALLDSLRGAIDSTDARLRGLRDLETRRVAARTSAILEACAANARWADAMRILHVNGPDSLRNQSGPDGAPGPNAVLSSEQDLTSSIAGFATRLAAQAPGLLARSYERAWGPGLVDRAVTQAAEAGRDLAWATALSGTIDSSLAAAAGSEALRRHEAAVVALSRRADSLARDLEKRREDVARETVERTLAALETEREGIDYGLAASAYALAVHLGARDTVAAPVAVQAGAAAGSAPASPDEAEDPDAARWRGVAIPLLRHFLEAHPSSASRGEVRFRLADLELVDARQQFRERMAAFLRGQGSRGALPVLDPARALALYRRILDEDPAFEHRDAVLFNAGMILADAGEPESRTFFSRLVREHPQSAYGQEAWLRMGDMEFNDKAFPRSVEMYARAAAGADPTLAVIADYKMGWAHYNQDRFEPAADAFRAVLDLYGARRADIQVDIEGEAEAYLVHSLAGAGGAPAFERTFDRSGPRPYERRVLMALGQHFRRYGEFAAATATDATVLRRWPDGPEALVAARRMIETHRRADRRDLEQAAKLDLAPRFARGGSWYAAQSSEAARDSGEAFARDAWLSVALARHRKARDAGGKDDWREARRLYEVVLEHWPKDPDAARLELGAGEASAQLGEYAEALRHDEAAARSGDDSLAVAAMWQRVAVTDAWYEKTRAGHATGSDSLAHAVLAAGDAMLARFPSHARGADIVWRQGQLGLAHGWNDRAQADLERLTAHWPGDKRVPVAASQRAELLFRMERFEDAGTAFETALAAARAAGRDSLARRAERAIPVCAYRRAEAAVAADSNAYTKHAELFEQVALRWPAYEHSALAQYRAGLAWAHAGRTRDAVRALQALLERYPRCEYVRDARLQIAQVWEKAGEREQAAQAYLEFAQRHPTDDGAQPAWLQAADLLAAAGQDARADDLRLQYVRRYPGDVETAMTVFAALAERELAGVGPGRPVSALLAVPAARGKAPAERSRLAEYLALAKQHPKLVSRPLVAHVRFLQAEEAAPAFAALRLTQPLPRSIAAKKRMLDTLLARYRRCADLGVAEWSHASAFRIGQTLVQFAGALEHADAPPDLAGDDLAAYRNVLAEQARTFSVRGEDVWTELLRKRAPDTRPDAWMAKAQETLWPRLANRFLFMPEVDFPLLDGDAPPRERAADSSSSANDDTSRGSGRSARPLAGREVTPR